MRSASHQHRAVRSRRPVGSIEPVEREYAMLQGFVQRGTACRDLVRIGHLDVQSRQHVVSIIHRSAWPAGLHDVQKCTVARLLHQTSTSQRLPEVTLQQPR